MPITKIKQESSTTRTTTSRKKQSISHNKNKSIIDIKDRSKTIVHTVLANRMDKIEDSLPVLLESYLDAISYVNDDGFLPIHAACAYYARNCKVIETLINPFPIGIRTPVEVGFLYSFFL